MKKKIGTIIIAGVMACTMVASVAFTTGCGNNSVTEFVMPEGGFDTSKEVEIKFSHTMGKDLRDVLDYYITQFNVIYPNIKVTHEQVGGYEDVRDQIEKEIYAGTQPNLAYCYPDHVAKFNQSNAVLALNDFLPGGAYADMVVTRTDTTTESLGLTQQQKEDFIQGYYNEGFQFGDGTKMYTLPFAKSTEVMFYNKTFFTEHNLKVPETWAEMEEVCAAIKAIDPDCTPLGYDSEANLFITLCEQYGSPYTSSEGENFRFDNAKNREFVKMLKGWYDKGYFTTQEIYTKYTSNLFKAQDSYMCIGSSAGAKNQLPALVDGKYLFDVGITSIPQVDPNNPKVISQGPSICIFKQDDPQEVIASWLFAKYLTTNIGFQAQFSDVSGYVPVIKTVLEHDVYKDHLANANGGSGITALSALACMDQQAYYYTSPAFVGSAKARDEVGKLIQKVMTSKENVDSIIDKAFKDAIEECEYYVG